MTEQPFYSITVKGLPELVFQTKDELTNWIAIEKAAWEWAWSEDPKIGSLKPTDFDNLNNSFVNIERHLAPLDENIPAHDQGGVFNNFNNPMTSFFRNSNTIFPSKSVEGRQILAIKEKIGSDSARWYLRFATKQINLQSVSTTEDLALIIGGAVFDEDWAGHIGSTLKQERTNYRGEITKLENRVRELEQERRDDRKRLARVVRKQSNKRLARYQQKWAAQQSQIAEDFTKAKGSITETEDKYRNQMALLAPVQYWKDKARNHGWWELGYAVITLVFFVLAGVAIYQMANGAIDFLKGFTGKNETSAYIITSAALLGGTTLLFWLGRVVVKLFLSEHHLRTDCREKAVMTQAYLSMMSEDDRINETERAIILASIFRSSPDGIVKEEGPVDFGAAAIMGKALSR